MKIEIITTGNELISGLTLDTNFHWTAQYLTDNGFPVSYHTTVKDDRNDILIAFSNAKNRADVVIVTGGLGPTDDDLTAQVASMFFGTKLVLNDSALNFIKKRFKERKRKLLDINKKPAYLPIGSEIVENKVGTAPGFCYHFKNTVYIFLPGVHKEFKSMMQTWVIKKLNNIDQEKLKHKTVLIRTFGLKESEVAIKLKDLNFNGIYLGYRSHFPEIHLRLSASGKSKHIIEKLLNKSIKKLKSVLGNYIFSDTNELMEEVIGKLLIKKNLNLSLAESCTGGLISNRITNVPGSSKYFNRSIVCYSNDSKIKDLLVNKNLLEKYGAVSNKVVEAMAKGILKLSGSDMGLAVSGIAGPGGGTIDKPVGTVFIGIASKEKDTFSQKFNYHGDREQIKLITSTQALDMIRKFLLYYV